MKKIQIKQKKQIIRRLKRLKMIGKKRILIYQIKLRKANLKKNKKKYNKIRITLV